MTTQIVVICLLKPFYVSFGMSVVCMLQFQIGLVCPFNDHIAKTRDELKLHMLQIHRCCTVQEWAFSEPSNRKTPIHHNLPYTRKPSRGKATVGCKTWQTKTVMKDQSSASRHWSKTTSAFTVVTTASASVNNAQPVTVTSSIVR